MVDAAWDPSGDGSRRPVPQTASGSRTDSFRKNRLPMALMLLGALLYISVIGEALTGWPLDIRDSYLSELAARQHPTSWLFRTTDFLSGLAVIAATLLMAVAGGRWANKTANQKLLAVGLLIFAVATIVDSTLTPLDCALSVPDCQSQIDAGTAGRYEWMHNISSVVVGVGTVAAAIGLIRIYWPSRNIGVLLIAGGVLALILSLTIAEMLGVAPLGRTQRFQIALTGVMVAVSAWGLAKSPDLPRKDRKNKAGEADGEATTADLADRAITAEVDDAEREPAWREGRATPTDPATHETEPA